MNFGNNCTIEMNLQSDWWLLFCVLLFKIQCSHFHAQFIIFIFHFPLSGTRSLVPFVRSLSFQFTYECCTWWRSEESRLKLTFRISSWMNCVHMERTSINTQQTLLLSMPGEYMQMNSCVYSTSHYCNNWVNRLRVGSAFLSISLSKCFQMEK